MSKIFGERSTICQTVFMVVVAVIPLIELRLQAQQTPPVARPNRSDSKIATFERLLQVVTLEKQNLLRKQRVLDLLALGLDFRLSDEDRQKLNQLRVRGEIMTAINKAAEKYSPPAPPSEPPPPPKEGQLSVKCVPVDCSVSIDNGPDRKTNLGNLPPLTLPEGPHKVQVKADGYETRRSAETVNIVDKKLELLSFEFAPTRALKEKIGAKLLQTMTDALGGEEGVKEAGLMRGRGEATVQSKDGKQPTWTVTTYYRAPGESRFDLSRGPKIKTTYFLRTGKDPYWTRDIPDAADLEDQLRRVHQYQLAALVTLLRGSTFKAVAEPESSADGAGRTFRIEGTPDTYIVKLDQDSRPSEIKIESPGLNNGTQLLLSEYVDKGKAWYPRRVEILLPGPAKPGIALRYEEIVLGSGAVTDADFDAGRKNRRK